MEKLTLIVGDKEEVFEGLTKEECQKKFFLRISELKKEFQEKRSEMVEESAEGKVGYILEMPDGHRIFRVYDPDHKFVDYELHAQEIEVKILSKGISLFKSNKPDPVSDINWSTRK